MSFALYEMGDAEGIITAEKEMALRMKEDDVPVGQSQAHQIQFLAAAIFARLGCLSKHKELIQAA